MITDINESLLRESIETSSKPIFIDFYAVWCGPCRMAEPLLKDLSEKNSEFLDFYKVNVDENRYIAEEYGVRNIPTFIIVQDGEVKTKVVGSVDREKLENLISEYTNN